MDTIPNILKLVFQETGQRISFPKWSQLIFLYDLKHFPVKSIPDFCLLLTAPPYSYLSFFEKTRGFPRSLNGKDKVWNTFQQGSLVLYFDRLFYRMLSDPKEIDTKLLYYMDILGKNPVPMWDHLVGQFGACCIEFFLKAPEDYCQVTSSTADHALLQTLGKSLNYQHVDGEISRQDSRSDLIKMATSGIKSPSE